MLILHSWDKHYQKDLDGDGAERSACLEASQLESWFDDVGAPEKVSNFVTSPDFPLFTQNASDSKQHLPLVLDLGTGNGSMLISLALEEGVEARMVGIDYSEPSISLARQLWVNMLENHKPLYGEIVTSIEFAVFDLIRDDHKTQSWWPDDDIDPSEPRKADGFDLVLDKGTFDAISLSSEMTTDESGTENKVFETYPSKVANMVRPGGYFLITSCNWTEEEVIKRFTTGEMQAIFEVFHKIKYPVYQFGGQQGQGVASVCFRKQV